jgi:hypothetical protein
MTQVHLLKTCLFACHVEVRRMGSATYATLPRLDGLGFRCFELAAKPSRDNLSTVTCGLVVRTITGWMSESQSKKYSRYRLH